MYTKHYTTRNGIPLRVAKELILLSKRRYEELLNNWKPNEEQQYEQNKTETKEIIKSPTPIPIDISTQTGNGQFFVRTTEDDGIPGILNHTPRKSKKRKNIQWLRY